MAGATVPGHPSAHRHRVGLAALGFALGGGPLAWAAQFNLNYALASHACFPHFVARDRVLPGWEGLAGNLAIINALALAVALVAAMVSWRVWRATRQEHAGGPGHALEAGEGRTRFLALCGLMTGPGFFVATLFNTVVLFTVPPCAG